MIRISNEVSNFYLIKTFTGRVFVVELNGNDPSTTMVSLCKAVVEIEQRGYILSGVYRLTENSTGQRVTYRASKAYKDAKKAYLANKEA